MPLLIASEIYGESTEDPPNNEPPLEARKVRFRWLASGPDPNQEGIWIPLEFDGVDVPTYMFRYDMINGGRRARTDTEDYMESLVRTFVRWHDKFKGWWPRIEVHCGKGCDFNVIFLRQTNFNPQSHVKIPPGTPEPVTTIWGPHLDSDSWVEPTSEVLFVPSQDSEALETASSSEESSERSESSEESSEGRESAEDDMTNKDDSDDVPSTTDPEGEARRQARMRTLATMRQIYRFDSGQIERRDSADLRESLTRMSPRGPWWSLMSL